MSGPPGAGKTTVGGLIAARLARSVHVEADRFFESIKSGFVDPWKPESHEQNTKVMRIVGDVAAAYAHASYFTIVEGIVIPRWFLAPLTERLWDQGHEVAYVVLRAPLELCLARHDSVPREVVEQLWCEFADLGELERHAVDTTVDEPDAVVDEILAGLDGRFGLPR